MILKFRLLARISCCILQTAIESIALGIVMAKEMLLLLCKFWIKYNEIDYPYIYDNIEFCTAFP
ncbi:hypothetical protein C4886_17575 [Blautia obeum]|uniref:Uncharacterized protein n=1 Tax=Blautia obeum TaxID=40520 RepID=A0A367FTJ1_9FIRM|nr:hypothetical protein C4886_17575 [Blautia obeum]